MEGESVTTLPPWPLLNDVIITFTNNWLSINAGIYLVFMLIIPLLRH